MSEAPLPSEPKGTLQGAMVKGAAWMSGMRWTLKLIGLINTIILARLLSPEDFGIIAMATVVVGLLEQFSEFYVDQVLLREKSPDRSMYDSAWTTQLIIGSAMGLVIFLLAGPIATYYGEPRVELVVQIISLRAVFASFQNIGVVDFRRNLDFRREFLFWVISRLAQFVLALGLVFYMRNYLALAIAISMAILVKVCISYIMSSYRPKLCFEHVGKFWKFARWMLLINVAQYSTRRGDEFVVGSYAPPTTLGAYYIGADFAIMLTGEVLEPTGRAFLPVYTRLKDNPAKLAETFFLVISFAAMVALPIGFGASAVAEDLITVVFGQKWSEAVPFFSVLAIFGCIAGFVSVVQPMLIVQGYEKVNAIVQVTQAVTVMTLLFGVAQIGIVLDIAIARTLAMTFFFGVYCFILLKFCLQTLPGLFSAFWRPVIASLAMWYSVTTLHDTLTQNMYLSLAFDIGVGLVAYSITIFILWLASRRPHGAEQEIMKWLDSQRTRLT